MRIILVRHAPSLGQKHPKYYVKYGDSRVPLDPEHEHLASKCGEFLYEYLKQEAPKPSSSLGSLRYIWNQYARPLFNYPATPKWPLVWTSQFVRSQDTWEKAEPRIRPLFKRAAVWHTDPRLNEQSFGLLPYIEHFKKSQVKEVAQAAKEFSQALYKADPFNNKTFMGEAPRETMESAQNFLDGTFWRDVREGRNDFLFFGHGAKMKSIVINWFHLYGLDAWKQLETPGNCDVWVIEGKPKDWVVKKIYDGERAVSLLDAPINPIEGILRPNEKPPPPLILP